MWICIWGLLENILKKTSKIFWEKDCKVWENKIIICLYKQSRKKINEHKSRKNKENKFQYIHISQNLSNKLKFQRTFTDQISALGKTMKCNDNQHVKKKRIPYFPYIMSVESQYIPIFKKQNLWAFKNKDMEKKI